MLALQGPSHRSSVGMEGLGVGEQLLQGEWCEWCGEWGGEGGRRRRAGREGGERPCVCLPHASLVIAAALAGGPGLGVGTGPAGQTVGEEQKVGGGRSKGGGRGGKGSGGSGDRSCRVTTVCV